MDVKVKFKKVSLVSERNLALCSVLHPCLITIDRTMTSFSRVAQISQISMFQTT